MDDLKERLRHATAGALKTVPGHSAPGTDGPRPGDVYALPGLGDLPVEWVVLDPSADGVQVVPADSRSFVGLADVPVPSGEEGGPLILRCRHVVSLPLEHFRSLRPRRLAIGSVAQAVETIRLLQRGALEGSPVREETEDDATYREWMAELGDAIEILKRGRDSSPSGARRPVTTRSSQGPWKVLAAVLALAVLGLTILVLRPGSVDPDSDPYPIALGGKMTLDEPVRDPLIFVVEPETRELLFELSHVVLPPCEPFRLEFLDATGGVLWADEPFQWPDSGEKSWLLGRHFLEKEPAEIRVYGWCDGEWTRLDERRIQVDIRSK